MSFWEQVALGALCFGRAIREGRRLAVWITWLPMLALQALALLALVGAAHPLASWLMAPLLTRVSGDDALRYPQGFHRLPLLAAQSWFLAGALLGPLCVGAAARAYADAAAGRRARAGAALGEALRRWPSLWLAALPTALVAFGVQAGLGQLADVRLSGPTRALLPFLGGAVQLLGQAACAYPPIVVALERRGPFPALARLPATLGRGFVPAAVVLLVLVPTVLPFDGLAPWALADAGRDLPEISAVLAAARSVVQAAGALLASGALAYVYLAALAPGSEDA